MTTANGRFIEVKGLRKYFPVHRGFLDSLRSQSKYVKAIDDIDFFIQRGEILGLAGESGSGKTTTGEIMVRLQDPTAGGIFFDTINVADLQGRQLKEFRLRAQMIFQDPYETFSPRLTVFGSIVESLKVHRIGTSAEKLDRVKEALTRAELRPAENFLYRYPHELSGGQRQRVAIARAMVVDPQFIVADEPVSMLDVSIRAGVLNLLKRLRSDFGLTMLYVSHDLSTVTYLCDRQATMYLGKIVEVGPSKVMVKGAHHPYTKALFSAVPLPNPDAHRERTPIEGEITGNIDLPRGCRFNPRCPYAIDICFQEEPDLVESEPGHATACHVFPARTD